MNKKVLSLLLTIAMVISMVPAVFAANEVAHACDSSNGTYCIVCDVAEKINNLPAADAVTINNAASVTDQIHAIDRLKVELTDAQYDEMLTMVEAGNDGSGYGVDVPVRYMNAVKAVQEYGGNSLYVRKNFVAADGSKVNVENAKVQFSVTNVATGASQVVTMSTMSAKPGTLSADADFYSVNEAGDGWTFKYILPTGTYRVEEVSDSGATVDGQDFVTTEVTYNGTASTNGILVTLAEGASDSVNASNVMNYVYNVDAKDAEGNSVLGVGMSIQGVDETGFSHTWTTDGETTALVLVAGREYTLTVTSVPDGYTMPDTASVTFTSGADASVFTAPFAASESGNIYTLDVTIPTVDVGGSGITINFLDRDGNSIQVDGEYSKLYVDENGDSSYSTPSEFTNTSSYQMSDLSDGRYDITVTNIHGNGYAPGGFIMFDVQGGRIVETYDEEYEMTYPYSNSHTILNWTSNTMTVQVASIMYDFSVSVLGIDAAFPYEVKDTEDNVVSYLYDDGETSGSVHLEPGTYKYYALVDENFKNLVKFPAEDEYLEFTVNDDYTITVNGDYNTHIDDYGDSYWLTWYLDSTDTVNVTATISTSDGTNFPEYTTITLYVDYYYDAETGETYYSEVQSIQVPTDVSEFTYTWTAAAFRSATGEDGETELVTNSYVVKGTDSDWNEIYFAPKDTNVFEAVIPGAGIEVYFSTMPDAGYYAETADSEGKVGVIAFNAGIDNFDNISDRIVNYGMSLFKGDYDDTLIDYADADVSVLAANGGYYHSIVKNIAEDDFYTTFYAIPFVVVDGDSDINTVEDQYVVVGDVMYASVAEYYQWFGNVNPY